MDKKVAHAHKQSSVIGVLVIPFAVLIIWIIELEAAGSSIIVIQIMHGSNISVTSTSA